MSGTTFRDMAQDAAPAVPAASTLREYMSNVAGAAGLHLMDSAGDDRIVCRSDIATYRFIQRTIITTVGNSVYTPSSGAKAALVRCVGGGGAGGGAAASTAGTNNSVGGGGEGGWYADKFITPLAASYNVTVGAGGTPGAAGSNPGGAGGETIFDTTNNTVVAKGGAGGAGGGASGTALGIRGTGGSGGNGSVPTAGDLFMNGEPGSPGVVFSVVAATGMLSGAGGSSLIGMGGNSLTASGNGVAGFVYGGGGSGGCDASSTNRQGGAGAQGIIIIDEYVG